MIASKLLDPGFLTSGPLLLDIILTSLACAFVQYLFFPVIRMYKQSKFIDQHLGSNNKHPFYGHLFKVNLYINSECRIQ